MARRLPERLGPYRIHGLVGEGGMGAVLRATDERTGEERALKVPSPELLNDPTTRQRFEREGRAAVALRHPNVVTTFAVESHEGAPFLVLELVPGGSLADRLKREGRLPWRDAARLGAGIARGLAAIHEKGLVHRDLKPANVLLDGPGTPKLADLGLVRRIDGASVALTKTGELLGTLAFMAPEQTEGGTAVDGRTDLYALGGTLHALVAGSPPFHETGVALVRQILFEPPPALATIAPEVSRDFERLVQRLLAKAPGERPSRADEVAAELDRLAAGAAPNRRGARLAAAVFLLVLAAAAALATRPPPPLPPPPPPALGIVPRPPAAPAPPSLPARLAALSSGLFRLTHTSRLDTAWRSSGSLLDVAVSLDGKRAFTPDEEGGLVVWDLATGDVLHEVRLETRADVIALSPGGTRLAVGFKNGAIAVLDVTSAPRALSRWAVHGEARPVRTIAFASEKRLMSGSAAGVAFTDLDARDPRPPVPHAAIPAFEDRTASSRPAVCESVAATADGRVGLAAFGDGVVQVWDLEKLAETDAFVPRTDDTVTAVRFLRDGTALVALRSGKVSQWDVGPKRSLLQTWEGSSAVQTRPSVGPNEQVAFGTADGVRLLDAKKRGPVAHVARHHGLAAAAYLPDGRLLSVGRGDQRLVLGPPTAAPAETDPHPHAVVVSLAPRDDVVIWADATGRFGRWDHRSGVTTNLGRAPADRYSRLGLTADGRALVTPAGGELELRELGAAQASEARHKLGGWCQQVLVTAPFGRVSDAWARLAAPLQTVRPSLPVPSRDVSPAATFTLLALSPDAEALLVSGPVTRGVQVVPLDRGGPITKVADGLATSACWLGPRSGVVGLGGGLLLPWVAEQARPATPFPAHARRLNALAFSPGPPRRLFSAAEDGAVTTRDPDTLAELDRIDLSPIHDLPTALAVTPDGKGLWVGTARGRILRFALDR